MPCLQIFDIGGEKSDFLKPESGKSLKKCVNDKLQYFRVILQKESDILLIFGITFLKSVAKQFARMTKNHAQIIGCFS